jgi:valyl-tRNA synthetase
MLPKGAYNPLEVEEQILKAWLDSKVYKPEYDPKSGSLISTEEMKTRAEDTFCIICPPPNAYARPHLGNVSGYAYQDMFARYARMHGKTTLLIPGKDHAAQEAESIFLREVLAPKGESKADYTREEIYSAAYNHFTGMMEQALKDEQRIGLSADYDRNIFTLDPRVEKTVMDTFMKLYQDELVYKDVRIVNWSTGMQSVIADIDVEYKEEKKGTLTYIKYPVLEKNQNVWRLSFYNPQIVDAIKAGTKTIETRALNPEEPDRYFGNIKSGDIVIVDDKSRKEKIPYLVRDVRVYKDALEYFQKEDLGKVFSTGSVPTTYDEMIERYEKLADNYGKKIAQNGIVAIELAPFSVSEYITVATTRPETMLGDTAVVVDPTDRRYKDLIGKYVLLPLMDRKIPVIANGRVDKEFGTGAVKVTPAHFKMITP